MRLKDLESLNENVVFHIGMQQLYASAKALGIEAVNTLSPIDFSLASPGQVDSLTQPLLSDDDFINMMALLSQPESLINIKGSSEAEGDFASSVYFSQNQEKYKAVWVTEDLNGQVTFVLFRDAKEWLGYYMAVRGYMVEIPQKAPLQIKLDNATIALLMHTMDVYKHAYYGAMLNYTKDVGNHIPQNEYFDLLKAGAQSQDRRWLLPALLTLTDWHKKGELELTADALGRLIDAHIIKATVDAKTGEKAFMLGAEGLYMAIEYTVFKKDVSLMTFKKEPGQVQSLFMITTEESIHVYDMNQTEKMSHYLYTANAFYEYVLGQLKG